MDLVELNSVTITMSFCTFYSIVICICFLYNLDRKVYPMSDKEYYLFYQEWVSFVHGLVAIVLSAYWFLLLGIDYDNPNTFYEVVTLWNTLGYMINDTVWMLLFKSWDLGILIHHLLTSVSLPVLILKGYGAGFWVVLLYYGELSNPFFQIRNQLKRLGFVKTKTYQVFLWVYGLIYIVFRAIMATIEVFRGLTFLKVPYIFKVMMCMGQVINLGWMIFVSGMLWKSIPYWYSNPDQAMTKQWWINGRDVYAKLTKQFPYNFIIGSSLFLGFSGIPAAYATWLHYNDNSLF